MVKENDFVFCTVKNVEGTTVFVELEDKTQGSIVFSEVAAGRIRNIREYVHPNKKIVCKVLKVLQDHIELSLRRVTSSEKEEIMGRNKREKTFENMLKAITKDYASIIEKIRKEHELWLFYDQIKDNPKSLDSFLSKSQAESLVKQILEKKEKEKLVKKTITLKSTSEIGLSEIKDLLKTKEVNIFYLGSSKFSIESTANDYKKAENVIDSFIEKIKEKSKEKKILFELIEK